MYMSEPILWLLHPIGYSCSEDYVPVWHQHFVVCNRLKREEIGERRQHDKNTPHRHTLFTQHSAYYYSSSTRFASSMYRHSIHRGLKTHQHVLSLKSNVDIYMCLYYKDMLINLICLSFSIWNNFNIIYILIHQRLNHIFIYMVSDFKSLSLLYNTINSITE